MEACHSRTVVIVELGVQVTPLEGSKRVLGNGGLELPPCQLATPQIHTPFTHSHLSVQQLSFR